MSHGVACPRMVMHPDGHYRPLASRPCTCPIHCSACGGVRFCFCVRRDEEYEAALADARWMADDLKPLAEDEPVYDAAAMDRDYERWQARESERAQERIDFERRERW